MCTRGLWCEYIYIYICTIDHVGSYINLKYLIIFIGVTRDDVHLFTAVH